MEPNVSNRLYMDHIKAAMFHLTRFVGSIESLLQNIVETESLCYSFPSFLLCETCENQHNQCKKVGGQMRLENNGITQRETE